MKLKALLLTVLFAAGLATSVAVAKGPPPGKGKNKTASTSTSTSPGATTSGKHAAKKMWICHRTGSGRYVKLRINKKAWKSHERHGDYELGAANGSTTSGTTSTGTTATGSTSTGKSKGAGSCAAAAGGTGSTSTTTTP